MAPAVSIVDNVSTLSVSDHNPMIEGRLNEIPGPGAYTTNPIERSPKYSMSKSRRRTTLVRTSDTLFPGVGIYTPKPAIAKRASPLYSLGKRIMSNMRGPSSPGPAAYTPTTAREKQAVSMPREMLPSNVKNRRKTVGPGQYNALQSIFESRNTGGHKFTKAVNRRASKFVE